MLEIKHIPGTKDKQTIFFSGKQPTYEGVNLFHFQQSGYSAGFESWFVRDTSNTWYNQSPNLHEILKKLCKIIREFKGRTVFIGSSMGGYGAIKLGLECLPDKIIAFSPQFETEFGPNLGELYDRYYPHPKEIEVHICKTSTCHIWDDISAAEKMSAFAKIIKHDCSAHNCAELLRNSGKMVELIRAA